MIAIVRGKIHSKKSDDDFHSVRTIDGVEIWMKRYPAKTKAVSSVPVVLCHGLLANKHSLDYGEEDDPSPGDWRTYSLAAYLSDPPDKRKLSFDVWVPELRGRRSYSEYDFAKRGQVPEAHHWCVDDYIDKDVPAIIHGVLKTYARQRCDHLGVFWVGMSMGGMLAYAYGQTQQGFMDLKGVVTIGSPVCFKYSESLFGKLKAIAPRKMFIRINLRSILENNARFKQMFIENALQTKNIDPAIAEHYIERGFDNSISSKVLSQFGVFYRHQSFCRYPRHPWAYDVLGRLPFFGNIIAPYSWTDHLSRFKSPLLALAGGADEEAPVLEVRYAVDHVGSTDVTYRELSEETVGKDYSHLDFHLSRNVREECYSLIYEWLVEQVRGKNE